MGFAIRLAINVAAAPRAPAGVDPTVQTIGDKPKKSRGVAFHNIGKFQIVCAERTLGAKMRV